MYYPTIHDVESIIEQMNKRYNMTVVVTNKGQLEFALQKPKMKPFGHEQYPNLYQKAAALMESITKIHALSDGNKRTAMMTAEFMIKANGGELVLPLKAIRLSVDTAMDENDKMTDLIQQWFKVHISTNVNELCAILYECVEEEKIIKELLNDKKFQKAEEIVGKWMAFDSYPENKATWDELTKMWQKDESVRKKSTLKQNKFGGSEMWNSVMEMAKHENRQYADLIPIPVKSPSDMMNNNNSMEELLEMEKIIEILVNAYRDTKSPGIIQQNAIMMYIRGNYPYAISLFQKLRKLDKDESFAVGLIGRIYYYGNNDPESALHYWRIYEKYQPEDFNDFHNIGFPLTDLEKYADALPYLEKALKRNPNLERTVLYKGICHRKLEQYEDAISCFKKCVALNQDNMVALRNLGVTLLSLKRFEEALIPINHALSLDPKDWPTKKIKAGIYANTGKITEGLTLLEEIVKTNPEIKDEIANSKIVFDVIKDSERFKKLIR